MSPRSGTNAARRVTRLRPSGPPPVNQLRTVAPGDPGYQAGKRVALPPGPIGHQHEDAPLVANLQLGILGERTRLGEVGGNSNGQTVAPALYASAHGAVLLCIYVGYTREGGRAQPTAQKFLGRSRTLSNEGTRGCASGARGTRPSRRRRGGLRGDPAASRTDDLLITKGRRRLPEGSGGWPYLGRFGVTRPL